MTSVMMLRLTAGTLAALVGAACQTTASPIASGQLGEVATPTTSEAASDVSVPESAPEAPVTTTNPSPAQEEPVQTISSPDEVVTTSSWPDLDGHPDLLATDRQPSPVTAGSWRGILRINCDLSHTAYDDPVVLPGQEGAAHLHRFYGNPDVDHATTPSSLVAGTASTCQGGALNLSSYWMPAVLAPDTGDGWTIVPAVVGGDDEAHEVFYYSAGVSDVATVQPIPEGLVMVAGDARATPDAEQDTSIVRWHCQSWESDDATNPRFSSTIPTCTAPDRVRLDIFFPSCWNGVDLDADDHASHLAYPVSDGRSTVCPESHPVPIVRVSYHMAFGVKPDVWDPSTRSSLGWQLASDTYEVTEASPGGASAHADWMNGWHPDVMQEIVDGCIRQQWDCHDGNLGNGWRLSGVTEGSGDVPGAIAPGPGGAQSDTP